MVYRVSLLVNVDKCTSVSDTMPALSIKIGGREIPAAGASK